MDNILELQHISKQFPGVKALDDVTVAVKRGTIHGLAGENGAGKSTLIKVLGGIVRPDSGKLFINGREEHLTSPLQGRQKGIAIVHQEIRLAETLSVAENLFLGNPIRTKMGLMDWPAMRQQAETIFREIGIEIDPNTEVSGLTVAKKQIVEIMKAVNTHSQVLIMDEPSAVLTERELEVMFRIVRQLKDKGVTILYISHRLEEVLDLCDEVTVLRDGKLIGTKPAAELDRQKLITMMIGHELEQEYPKEEIKPGPVVMRVQNLSTHLLQDISFQVRKGEIFGISGLVGAGRTELARAILGLDPVKKGKIILDNNRRVKYANFRKAIGDGFGLVPEDRSHQGLVLDMPIAQNTTLVNLEKLLTGGVINRRKELAVAREYAEKLHIAAPDVQVPVKNLSGGNQQKVVIAKWLFQDSDILFLDEPTRGVDVGAKAEIYRIMTDLVKQGKTIIMISSEMMEILGMCDRIMVMHEGRKTGELTRAEASQEKIMSLCV